MLKCIIVDDERNAREALQHILEKYFDQKIKILAQAQCVADAVDLIKLHQPDLVFLDVEMPNEPGFKLFNYFDDYNFNVIFTTAYDKYALQAIKCSALDYLLKPVDFIELRDAIKKIEQKNQQTFSKELINNLLSNFQPEQALFNKIAIPTKDGLQFEKINEIVYLEADGNNTIIYLRNNTQIVSSQLMKKFEEILPSQIFYRIHKSYILNINYLQNCNRIDGGKALLTNGITLDISGRIYNDFIKFITKPHEVK